MNPALLPHPAADAAPPARRPRRRTPEADEPATRLALAARDGDPDTVDRFIRALHRDVWQFVAHLSDRQSADDLTQETFIRALRGLPSFEGRCSARAWLLSIARRTVVDSFRRQAARPKIADQTDWEAVLDRTQTRHLPGIEDGIALADIVAGLPAELRAAFVLTQLLKFTYVEASDILGCPGGTIRSRVYRARALLTALLADAEACSSADPPGP